MTPDPVVLPADTPVVDAVRAMPDRRIGTVVVKTDAGIGES
jgi:CBS domain-containing protein